MNWIKEMHHHKANWKQLVTMVYHDWSRKTVYKWDLYKFDWALKFYREQSKKPLKDTIILDWLEDYIKGAKESNWKQYCDDTIVNKVVTEFIKRSELGKKKYWTTLDRNDLWLRERLQHLKEELMDAVNYIEKCLFMLK